MRILATPRIALRALRRNKLRSLLTMLGIIIGVGAVIGKTVADQLFPNQDPLGQTLRIRNIPFTIVGVLASKGFNLFGQDQDDVVLVPYTSHMRRISSRTFVNSILVQAANDKVIDLVQQEITDTLSARHRSREPDFTVR